MGSKDGSIKPFVRNNKEATYDAVELSKAT